ncbi:MAG TPA: hypothetical protein VNV88_14485, partial [Candidatus Solibacter sp.]|nr:hypothetical protein [Candidatus Solibacter sp.]
SGEPLWTANLYKDYGFQRFDREIRANWLGNQGLAFLSAGRIAVYQVNQKAERVKLGPRDASGGAGNFYLQLEILDSRDGHEIAQLRLPACGMLSGIMPTHDGNFIVRTGEMLNLYSSSLQRVASYRLPLEKGESQIWETQVASSGDIVVAIRRPLYADLALQGKPTYVEILDATTLQLKNAFSPQHPAGWFSSVGDHWILSDAPQGKRQWSMMDFNGNWNRFDPSLSSLLRFRYRYFELLAHDYLAVYGKGQLVILSKPEEAIFKLVQPHQFFESLATTDGFLAVKIASRPAAYENGKVILPDTAQVEAYDLKSQSRLVSIEVSTKGLYFAISPQGDLGIIHEGRLEVLRGNAAK